MKSNRNKFDTNQNAQTRNETSSRYETKRVNGSTIREQILPFRQLPDVSSIKIETFEADPLFEIFGIKKSKKKAKISIEPCTNAKRNRYLLFTLLRLKKLNDRQYGNESKILMRTSMVFGMVTLRSISPTGHRDLPLGFVRKAMKEALRLATGSLDEFSSKRVYIAKSNNKMRPLGVPSLPGRLYLNLLNNFLVYRLKDVINKSQHGFVPRRGTMTAGSEILKIADKARDIYEIDLENAFNSLSLKHICRTLNKHNIPKDLIMKILLCSLSPTKFGMAKQTEPMNTADELVKKNKEIDDLNRSNLWGDVDNYEGSEFWNSIVKYTGLYGITKYQMMRLIIKACGNHGVGNKRYFKDLEEKRLKKVEPLSPFNPELYENGSELAESGKRIGRLSMNNGQLDSKAKPNVSNKKYKDTKEIISYTSLDGKAVIYTGTPKEIKDHLKNLIIEAIGKYNRMNVGVAQGSPCSPFIFALCVNDHFFKKISNKDIKCIAYADDAIFYGKIDSESQILKDSPTTGLIINKKKSGGVKRNYKFEKKLKFLGMTLENDGRHITGSSETRTGNNLRFDKELLLRVAAQEAMNLPFDVNFFDELEDKNLAMQRVDEEIRETNSKLGKRGASFGELDHKMLSVLNELESRKEGLQEQYKFHTSLDLQTKLSTSGLIGFIQSRMYIGTGNYDISQDFTMDYRKGSWMDVQKKRNANAMYKFNIFNASSYAIADLFESRRKKLILTTKYFLCNLGGTERYMRYPIGYQRFSYPQKSGFAVPKISRVKELTQKNTYNSLGQ